MNDKRTSPSTQSIFVIPIGDEVELYLEYNCLHPGKKKSMYRQNRMPILYILRLEL